jgi:hypothetical protein
MRKTSYVCDVCERDVKERELVAVRVDDNDPHPHNGSTWKTDADICVDCLSKLSKISINYKPSFGRVSIADMIKILHDSCHKL